jgi:isopentenyl-diphosphate Delta-isomerase
MSIRSKRKDEHIKLAEKFYSPKKINSFDEMHIIRPALPEASVSKAILRTKMFGKDLAAPFFINAMTGGSQKAYAINQSLGKIASKTQIALALGSASILVKEHDQLDSFIVAREENPEGVIIANVNAATSAKDAQKIVSELKADALQIHLNAVQEIVMPEGERNFYWLDNLRNLRQQITVPLIIKEVGFGLDRATIHVLKNEGFSLFDIAGSGGTNFAQIENARNQRDLSYLETVGLPTVISAIMAKKEKVDFIVSGGIRNPLDVLKALCLGGKYVGIANTFLQVLIKNDANTLLQMILNWQKELAELLAVYGQTDLQTISSIPKYYDLQLQNWLQQL